MFTPTRSNLTWLTMLLAVVLAGCGSSSDSGSSGPVSLEEPVPDAVVATPDETPTLESGFVRTGDIFRSYRLYLPSSLNSDPVPLVLAFHGSLGSGEKFAAQTNLTEQAESDGFIAVFPDSATAAGLRLWNDGRLPEDTIDDVAFVRTLVAHLLNRHPIDPDRIFVTGASSGGLFSLRLACDAADIIAATAPVIASMPADFVPRCKPARPMPMLMINSDEDPFVPFWGGPLLQGSGGEYEGIVYGGGFVMSVFDTVDFWRNVNGCSDNRVDELLPEIDPDDGTRVRRIRYPDCTESSEVVLYVVEGGGHTWPGSAVPPESPYAGLTSREISASDVVWEFFQGHRLP
jgi:polyhydroxybutyrate depolymerase